MRCFNHQNRDSVGFCKHCNKGLCPDCLTDLGHGLACRNSHEQAVDGINVLIDRNSQAQRMAPKTWYVVPTFTMFMGLVFAGYSFSSPRGPFSFTLVLGLGFIAYSAVLFAINYRAYRASSTQA